MNFTKEADANLKRAKEVLSHKFPKGNDAEIIAYALQFMLDRVDPLRKGTSVGKSTSVGKDTSAAEAKRVIKMKVISDTKLEGMSITKAGAKRQILERSQGRCTYVDHVTGQICESRYQIQIDHTKPKALGGSDEITNLRPLCRQHNLFMAERVFGNKHMEKFRANRSELNRETLPSTFT